jgi:hypothetical protein
MFDNEAKGPVDDATTAEQVSASEGASSAVQVSDITTESIETQVEADATNTSSQPAEQPQAEVPVAPKAKKYGILSSPVPKFDSPAAALKDLMVQAGKSLTIQEDLMMSYINREDVAEPYYHLWRDGANMYFRSLCILRKRLARMQDRQTRVKG